MARAPNGFIYDIRAVPPFTNDPARVDTRWYDRPDGMSVLLDGEPIEMVFRLLTGPRGWVLRWKERPPDGFRRWRTAEGKPRRMAGFVEPDEVEILYGHVELIFGPDGSVQAV